MQFRYPARLQPYSSGQLIVSFRDLPECRTSGADEAEARGALEEAVAGRIADDAPASGSSGCPPTWRQRLPSRLPFVTAACHPAPKWSGSCLTCAVTLP